MFSKKKFFLLGSCFILFVFACDNKKQVKLLKGKLVSLGSEPFTEVALKTSKGYIYIQESVYPEIKNHLYQEVKISGVYILRKIKSADHKYTISKNEFVKITEFVSPNR